MAGVKPILNPVDLAGVEAPIAVPSGQSVTLQEVLQDAQGPDGLTIRFRFLAPQIARQGGSVGVNQAQQDMQFLCQTYAIPRLSNLGPKPSQVVISLSDVAVPFGESAPDATQYFDGYRIENDTCIWEPF